MFISSILKSSDSIYSMNRKIVNDVVNYDTVISDDIAVVRSLNLKDFNQLLTLLKDYETGTITIYPKEEK